MSLLEKIIVDAPFQRALDAFEDGEGHVFLTGKAGTGKSTLLSYFRESTRRRIAVLAPTGVAAVTVRGQTVHSFFGFKPGVTVKQAKRLAGRAVREGEAEIFRELEVLVIDEVSMLRADLLDCVDAFLKTVRKEREKPFGGLRMIFIGDLYQLPPVVASHEKSVFEGHYSGPFFFDAKIFPKLSLEILELETVHRQSDPVFIDVLNAVRNNTISDEHLAVLNGRCLMDDVSAEDMTICLVATNAQANAINERKLGMIPSPSFVFEGNVDGDFSEKDFPTEKSLRLKTGAQVMLLNNDGLGRWVNGTMATVIALSEGGAGREPEVMVELETGGEYELKPVKWDLIRYRLDEKKKTVTSEPMGSFTQFPLKLAWAVTIHKSQGKTFDRVVIDLSRGFFAPGQMYVALSRCRRLERLSLTRPLERRHVFVDRRIASFMATRR
ncbi:MAG TPA: AAA family ATPase [bacterium]|nr:AAA family ATPase [bacterium]